MAKDLEIDENGDLVIDPTTHDLALVTGTDEIVQRIKATLDIYYGEMENIAPEVGADYSNLLGKNYDTELAIADMTSAITAGVPEITGVDDMSIDIDRQTRKATVNFAISYSEDDTGDSEQEAKGAYEIGT
ncbi:DUF2634 domain-containing protein [Lactobacillus delbrueckii]|nr:DUF2634 domain-containing protein [Lactobacillus delbrueckii]